MNLPGFIAGALLATASACTAAAAVERAIHKEVVVAAPVAEVWTAWTTRDGIRTFFAPDANVEARSGGAFEIFFNPYGEPGMKGGDGMRVLGVDPQKMLSFTWNAPPSLPEARKQQSVVIVRFKPLDAQRTEVTLHHVGWGETGEWPKAFDYFDSAWGRVLANLQKRFESGPMDWEPMLKQMRGAPR